ncbi:hypothetical protein KAT92_06755 [Candidatus Babeliales bacterium]|nr:hypothetical protein [Candidatus Babeliales bacterium]
MEEQLISYETAQLAKEKKCTLDLYEELEYEYEDEYGDTFVCNYVPEMNDKIFDVRRKINCTQSLLLKWLREVHRLHLNVIPSEKNGELAWDCQWSNTKQYNQTYQSFLPQWATTNCDTYEQALEEGLVKVLKLI